jgi:tyrosinase
VPILTAVSSRVAALSQMPTVSLTAQLTYRKSVYDLTAAEINMLRKGFAALAKIGDDRGYQYLAGIHGYPLPVYCQHGTPLFAVWHRPYLALVEKSLQAVVPGVALPYWDWTSQRAVSEGIPKMYADQTYVDPDTNVEVPNPLNSQPISFAGSEYAQTTREPGPPGSLAGLSRLVDIAQRTPDYVNFSANLENAHNGVHGWVGGTMGLVPYAAYDPIFWAHHANIDRLFAQWQSLHPGVAPPPAILQSVLAPFSVTVSSIWSISELGYAYVTSPEPSQPGQGLLPEAMMGTLATFSLSGVRPRFVRAELHFRGVPHPKDSIEVRVFANVEHADANTPTGDNPLYCGSLYLFGHGICAGDEGHCDVPDVVERDVFDIRPPHHLTAMNLMLDIGDTLAALLEQRQQSLSVSLVALDNQGRAVDASTFLFDELTLVAD